MRPRDRGASTHGITGCLTFSEVHVGDGRNDALSNLGNAVPVGTNVVDLTFATVSQRGSRANVKSKTTLDFMFASVPLVLTFVNEPAATRYECQNRDTGY